MQNPNAMVAGVQEQRVFGGEVREGQMRQGFVGHIKFSLYSKSSGKTLKGLSR